MNWLSARRSCGKIGAGNANSESRIANGEEEAELVRYALLAVRYASAIRYCTPLRYNNAQ
jgi:hypothetical protein